MSLDYCADQYLLQLADRSQILALSPDATKSFSYLRDEAHGLPSVRATAEDVLSLRPDLVVRSYGGGPLVGSFLERAGVPVVQLPWVVSVDGDSQSSVTAAISLVAARLGQDQRGRELIAEFRLRLRNVRAQGATGRAMYMSAAGFTSGSGTLISDLLATAGLQNYETRSGWHPLPLEALVYDTPERVASSFFGVASNHKNAWSAARHPIANQLRERGSTITLDGATTACGAWFIADAAEALAGVRVP
ncbi:MAG: ABC transporter substrate-binding protein [Pseudomonadota bacterium]